MNTTPSNTEELLRERVRLLEKALEVAFGRLRREWIRNDTQMGLSHEEAQAGFDSDSTIIFLRAALSQQKEEGNAG